ncbi:MAG: pyrimidine dimer DNA glycosylase/endonuclease V [Rhodocyclaceae bacterium]
MRLWTLHPRHLDPAGLVALWRESLLAQAVLLGRTRGYTKHPQLTRFRALADPPAALRAYLEAVWEEAASRGYAFDRSRIVPAAPLQSRIPETRGQLLYEWSHLGCKLRVRSPAWYAHRHRGEVPTAHPIFRVVPGKVRDWERPSPRRSEAGLPGCAS